MTSMRRKFVGYLFGGKDHPFVHHVKRGAIQCHKEWGTRNLQFGEERGG